MRRALFLAIIGLGGAAILITLGVWQVQRLAWKEELIASIEAQIGAAPVALPQTPDPARDAYLPVTVTGQFAGDTLRVLVSTKEAGAGYRLITPIETEQGRILIDRGFVPNEAAMPAVPNGRVTVTGNLEWPQETDGFTPDPDRDSNVWFARDVEVMAETLDTRPLLVVARTLSPAEPAVTPLPVDTARIPNDHLQYATTWFSLAAIWLAMSILFLRRRRAQSQG